MLWSSLGHQDYFDFKVLLQSICNFHSLFNLKDTCNVNLLKWKKQKNFEIPSPFGTWTLFGPFQTQVSLKTLLLKTPLLNKLNYSWERAKLNYNISSNTLFFKSPSSIEKTHPLVFEKLKWQRAGTKLSPHPQKPSLNAQSYSDVSFCCRCIWESNFYLSLCKNIRS